MNKLIVEKIEAFVLAGLDNNVLACGTSRVNTIELIDLLLRIDANERLGFYSSFNEVYKSEDTVAELEKQLDALRQQTDNIQSVLDNAAVCCPPDPEEII